MSPRARARDRPTALLRAVQLGDQDDGEILLSYAALAALWQNKWPDGNFCHPASPSRALVAGWSPPEPGTCCGINRKITAPLVQGVLAIPIAGAAAAPIVELC